jgi:FkbM family methyltransferase
MRYFMREVISYAQNQEDLRLNRFFPENYKGFYIDVGAADPSFLSVTKLFYQRGWRGINVEPQRHFHEALCRERPGDVNLRVGLSNRDGKMVLYRPTENELGTVSPEVAETARGLGNDVEQEEITVTTLAKVCEEHRVGEIDFLKVDVEGHERAVLEGADWGRWRPRVIVIEATLPVTGTPSAHLWEDVLTGARYSLALCDGLNNYYLRDEDRHLIPLLSGPDELQRLGKELERWKNQSEELTKRIEDIHASYSWRLTEPLRNVATWLRRGRNNTSPPLGDVGDAIATPASVKRPVAEGRS